MKIFELNAMVRRSIQLCSLTVLATALIACDGDDDSSSSSSGGSSTSSSSSSSGGVACSGALFCDDFESGNTGSNPQGDWGVSGNVELSSEQSYSGNQSVKVQGVGGGYNRNFMTLDMNTLSSAKSQMYGRMMMYLSSENTNGGDFTFIQADGAPKPSLGAPSDLSVMYRGRLDGGDDHFMANYDTWNESESWKTDCWKHPEGSSYSIPKNQWACVEWHFDSDSNELNFWMDGNKLDEISIQTTGDGCVTNDKQDGDWIGPNGFENLHLGIEQYHDTSRSRTMYIDDVSVDTRYVGCP